MRILIIAFNSLINPLFKNGHFEAKLGRPIGTTRLSIPSLSDRLLMIFLGIEPCMIEPSYDVDFTVTTRASPADDPHDQIIQFPK